MSRMVRWWETRRIEKPAEGRLGSVRELAARSGRIPEPTVVPALSALWSNIVADAMDKTVHAVAIDALKARGGCQSAQMLRGPKRARWRGAASR